MISRSAKGAVVAGLLLCVMVLGIATTNWDDHTVSDVPLELPTFTKDPVRDAPDFEEGIFTEDGTLKENTLAYTIFEKYSLILIPLGILMFGAMVGGVVISREEVEE